MDRKLGRSLSEFDEILMREQKAIAEDRAAASEAGAAAAAAAAGTGTGAGGAGAGDDGEEALARGQDPDSGAETEAESGDPGESVGDEEETARTAERIPQDVGDGRDDDVVARQLREAAMNEEDPELREKLWQEYREYKRSAGR